MATERSSRRIGNRVDHIAWIVKPENGPRSVKMLGDLFDTTFDFREGAAQGVGFDVWVAWSAGLEVVAPYADGPGLAHEFYSFLQDRGEGFWGVIYGVDDLEAAAQRARDQGWPVEPMLQSHDDQARKAILSKWTKTVIDVKEVIVGEFAGTKLLLGQIEYPPDR